MNSYFRKQFLQCILSEKPENPGFTLTELIIVTVIIGILSAIALPSMLTRANKARQTEAKLYVGAMNRAQQAYYFENTVFTNSIDELAIGIDQQTDNYQYPININANNLVVTHNGLSQKPALKSYTGITFLNTVTLASGNTEAVSVTLLCESPTTGVGTAENMASGNCPTGWILLPN
jgi:prepilin-type N-terminal cleavage/methylation domain-containing protein